MKGFLKGMAAGVAAGMAAGMCAAIMTDMNRRTLRKKADRAISAIESLIEDAEKKIIR